MKTIIITGCRGQLGREINKYYADKRGLEFINTDVDELDITDSSAHPVIGVTKNEYVRNVFFAALVLKNLKRLLI